jgi:hypothetical protein
MINISVTTKYYYSAIILLLIALVIFVNLIFNSVLTGLLNIWFFETLLINMCLLFSVFYVLACYNEEILKELKELKEVKND